MKTKIRLILQDQSDPGLHRAIKAGMKALLLVNYGKTVPDTVKRIM